MDICTSALNSMATILEECASIFTAEKLRDIFRTILLPLLKSNDLVEDEHSMLVSSKAIHITTLIFTNMYTNLEFDASTMLLDLTSIFGIFFLYY